MQIKTILAIATFAVTAFALPGPPKPKSHHGRPPVHHHHGGDTHITISQAINQCSGNNNGQSQVSCCNTESKDGLASIADNLSLLGGACQPLLVPVNVLGGGGSHSPVTEYCNNRVACCAGDSTGSGCTLIG